MSWCDKLGSTPAVGFGLEAHFISGTELLTALSPVLDRLSSGEKNRFSVESVDTHSMQFITDEGFRYGADPRRVHVTFNHRLKAVPTSAGLPRMEILSSQEPYTKLLLKTGEKAIEAATLLDQAHQRSLRRVGIMTISAVNIDDAPPGIARYIDYISAPWGARSDQYSINITGFLSENKDYIDKCLHIVSRGGDGDDLINITLDWYRTFNSPRRVNKSNLEPLFDAASKAALEYFEEVGEGGRFDAELIRIAS